MTSNVEPDPDHPSDPNSDSIYLTSKSGQYTDASIRLTEDDEFVCVVSIGAKFLYVITGFDVLGVELRHIQVKGFSKIGKPEDMFDMFIKNDLSLSRSYPSHMVLRDVTIIKVRAAQYNHLIQYFATLLEVHRYTKISADVANSSINISMPV